MSLPTPDEIRYDTGKERPLIIQPWVLAQLSDVWQGLRINVKESMKRKGKQGREQTSQAKPASVHNQT